MSRFYVHVHKLQISNKVYKLQSIKRWYYCYPPMQDAMFCAQNKSKTKKKKMPTD